MNIIPYIFYPLTLGLIFFTYAFFKWPKYAIAGLIIAKPIIDVSWDYHILLDINFLKLYAGLFVILGVIYIIVKRVPILTSHGPLLSFPISNASFPRRRESSNCHPELVSVSTQNSPFHRFSVSPFHFLSILWLIFLGLNFVSFFIISQAYMPLAKINYFLRILTGFVALIMFAHLFNFEKDKKFILSIFIIAGIFPILLWLIPVLMGNPIISNDPLQRIMGPYLNFWNFNFYATQTLICCLAYLALSSRHCEPKRSGGVAISTASRPQDFPPSKLHSIIKSPFLRFTVSLKSIFVLFMLIVSIAMIYKCYSKVGWITLATVLFIWFLLRKKYILSVLVPVIVAVILFVNPFAKDFQKTFKDEIEYLTHRVETKDMVFRGRLSRWGTGMQRFIELPVINKLFGAKKSIGDPENDYFRILWYNGVAGLSTYVVLLLLTGYFLLNAYVVSKQPVVLVGVLAFVGLIISSMGSYALYYPSQQWFMWGMVGFILSKDKMTVSTKH